MRLEGHSGEALQPLPHAPYQSPDQVVRDPDLTVVEKRAMLAAWCSDRYAVPSKPWLREVPGLAHPLALADILAALRKLDRDPPPRGGASARVREPNDTDATPANAGVALPQGAFELRAALAAAHRRNIDRYCRMLATNLTELERAYVHRRIAEERRELDRLGATVANELEQPCRI
jgi:hypothetical protein